MTTVNLGKEFEKLNSQRYRSYDILDTNERVDTIKLTTDILKKKKRKNVVE